MQSLLKRGELAEEEVRRLRDKLLGADLPLPGRQEPSEDELVQAFMRRGVPTRGEFEQLSRQVEALLAKLDSFSEDEG